MGGNKKGRLGDHGGRIVTEANNYFVGKYKELWYTIEHMQKFTIPFLAICFALVALLPVTTSAYVATEQTSVRLGDNLLMFLVTYQFGHETVSYKMPVKAERGTVSPDALSFNILKDGKLRTNIGKTVSVVLSDAETEGGKYVVPRGETKDFTLVAFLILPEERSASSTDYALLVSALPFEIGKDGEYSPNKLNRSELKNYRTPIIGTDEKIGITTHQEK